MATTTSNDVATVLPNSQDALTLQFDIRQDVMVAYL